MIQRVFRKSSWSSQRALLALFGGLTCCLGTTKGVPLYADSDVPRLRSDVALLLGPVEFVDGQEVASRGTAFDLLPGCHIVQIGGSEGHFESAPAGGWVSSLPPLVYAFQMRAGYTYTIEVEPDFALGIGPTGSAHIIAREHDGLGHVDVVPAARRAAAIDACRDWERERGTPRR